MFKLYHREVGSAELDAFLAEHEIDHFYISEIALVEFCSTAIRRFRFEEDHASYKVVAVNSNLIAEAKRLTFRRKSEGLKALDAIQLASAIAVKNIISVVKTSDERLEKIVVLEGLKTTLSNP